MNDAEKFRLAAKKCREMADLYEELADLQGAEETQENMDKSAMIAGKFMFMQSEISKIWQ